MLPTFQIQKVNTRVADKGLPFEVMETLSAALSTYKILARSNGLSEATITWTENAVKYFTSFLGGDMPVHELKAQDLRNFILSLRQKKAFSGHPSARVQDHAISPQSINGYIRAIKGMFSLLSKEGLLRDNPFIGISAPKFKPKVVPSLSEANVRRLLKISDKDSFIGYRNFTLISLFIDSACRASEVLNLKVSDVDLSEGILKVNGKTGQRQVPIGRQAAKTVAIYLAKFRKEKDDYLFTTKQGKPITRQRLEAIFHELSKKLGFRVYPHLLRHTSALAWLRNGGNAFLLQKRLGHRDLEMTKRYLAIEDSDLKKAHQSYSPLDRLL